MTSPARVHLIAAARPNFMKVAPLWHALTAAPDFEPVLIHTGQHYDANMSDAIFADLSLPQPDHHLGVGSGSHAEQTGRVMMAYEAVAQAERPDWLVVVGDVNSTLACALVGAKLRIPVVHLEAGLRSRDRDMPEEINRLATDAIADILWTPSVDGDENLLAEGTAPERIALVGNIMMDSFELVRPKIEAAAEPEALGLPARYGVVTLHRPSNVDDPAMLAALVDALLEVQARLPLVFPVHPRTAQRLAAAGLDAKLVAGGVTYLGIPCLTLRENTERPITIDQGTNRLVNAGTLAAAFDEAMATPPSERARPANWDGRTAERCVADLRRRRA
jgi:UDP-N-acetylglucosamine 2-epimerase (non-hydrolysing)